MKGGSGVTLKSTPYVPYNVKVGIKDSRAQQVPPIPPRDSWFLNDKGQVLGPIAWSQIMEMAVKAQITPYAQLRNADWEHWVPIWHYVRIKTPAELEAEALIPSRYDVIFFIGVFMFLIGLFSLIANPFLGVPLVFASPIIEFGALHLEGKHKAKATMRTFGNAIALFWIILQIVITGFFLFMII